MLITQSISEEKFVKWIERSLTYLNTVVESQILDNIDRNWPKVPKESRNRDSIEQKIKNLSENWKDYWESCTAEVVLFLHEGLEQTCKLAKKESRKASFKCFEGPLGDIKNEYIEKVTIIWNVISSQIPLESGDKEPERSDSVTSIIKAPKRKPKRGGECNSDPMEWMASFLEHLTKICATKSVKNSISFFQDLRPIIPPTLQTVIYPLATKFQNNWNFMWKRCLNEEDLLLLNWIDILHDSLKSPKGYRKAKEFQELQVYILMNNSTTAQNKAVITANAWKRFCLVLLQWIHCRVVSHEVEPNNIILKWPEVTEEPYNSQLNQIISVLNEKRETPAHEKSGGDEDLHVRNEKRETPAHEKSGGDEDLHVRDIEFKAETMDIVEKVLRSITECKDMEPPASIHKYQEKDQKSNLQWFNEIKQKLCDLDRKETRTTKTSKRRIQELEEEREDLLNRLSKLAGAKLKDNNPNITDLSDPNRPTKILEHFNEIYEKEWTSSLDTLCKEQKMEVKVAIQKLLEIVKDCYNFCVSTAEDNIASFLMCETSEIQKMQDTYFKNGEMNQLHEMRKAIAKYSSERVIVDFFNEHDKEVGDISSESRKVEKVKVKRRAATFRKLCKRQDHVKNYTNKCLEICWYMAIQSPPVHLDFSYRKGKHFNKSVLKQYTHNGEIIDFLVWPVTYRKEGGELLGKGVAQPEIQSSA